MSGNGPAGLQVRLDPAIHHVQHALAGSRHLGGVGGQQHRDSQGAVQFLQQLQHFGPIGGIQVPGGLIRQKQQGVVAHRPRDADPLHLSSRELLGILAEAMEQAQALEQPGGLPPGDVRGYAVQHEGKGRVFQGGEGGQEIEGLKDETDPTAADSGEPALVQAPEIGAVQPYASPGGIVHAPAKMQQGRLAAPGRSRQGDELSFFQGQVHLPHGNHGCLSLGVGLSDCLGAEYRHTVPPVYKRGYDSAKRSF